MKILGIDAATKTGWAIWDTDTKRLTDSGVEDFSKRRGESNGMMFLRFSSWLEKVIPYADVVCYEQAHYRGGAATEICVGLTTRIQEACERYGIEYLTVHTQELKKWTTGSGKSGKAEMISIARLYKKNGEIKDDNEADAINISHWAAERGI